MPRPQSLLNNFLAKKCEENNLATWHKYETQAKEEGCQISLSLCNLAKKFLTPPPTSTDVERLFSTAALIVDDCPRLLPENLEKLLFLKENLKFSNIKLDWT